MKESTIQRDIRKALGLIPGLVLFRNNVGTCTQFDEKGKPRVIVYGLGDGSADLIGCYNGKFIALEVKTPGKHSRPNQVQWANMIRYNGGHVAEVSSVEQALDFIRSIK
jgi:hypothetical protein